MGCAVPHSDFLPDCRPGAAGKEGGLSKASSYKSSSTAAQAAAQGVVPHRATRPFWEEQGE